MKWIAHSRLFLKTLSVIEDPNEIYSFTIKGAQLKLDLSLNIAKKTGIQKCLSIPYIDGLDRAYTRKLVLLTSHCAVHENRGMLQIA